MAPRASDRLFSLAALAAVAVLPLTPSGAPRAIPATATFISVAIALAASRADPAVRGVAALLACLSVAMWVGNWQAAQLVAIASFLLLGRFVPALRLPSTWRAKGTVPRGWTALVAGVTPVALWGWVLLMHPNLRDVAGRYLPDYPLPVLLLGAVGFAAVNATLEEVVYRGLLQEGLLPVFGGSVAIALQAASFGLQHAHGVPRGVVGVVLAGSWAVMLGLLRRQSRGLLAPVLAHFVADGVVASIVIFYAR